MPLIDLHDISLAFGGPVLLDAVDLVVEPGERICLLGRNGAGKSSLLQIIGGQLLPDAGEIRRQQGLSIGMLSQEVPGTDPGTIYEVVAGGMHQLGRLVAAYHRLSAELAADHDPRVADRLAAVQQRLEHEGGWQLEQTVATVISRLELDPDAPFATLSAGLKRRSLLARALVSDPDLLLLDEPTNHLDIDAIRWLETFLLQQQCSLLFVTHDRQLVRRLATRIVELDRGRLRSWAGDYDAFCRRRQETLAAEQAQQREQDKLLAREEAWIRQGIKARRTRNEGRVRRLEQLRDERRARRLLPGTVQLQATGAGQSGKIVCEAMGLCFGYADQPVIRDFSTLIVRGDRIGIIGPNGSGKTTLIRVLLGELSPDAGTLRHGTNLQIAYFDQLRDQLDPDATLFDSIASGNSVVTVNGIDRSVFGYLQDFLFPPERARSPVRSLSGGERNRLLLARLFTRPANLLVLDEPTNDLDIETLELLEEQLMEFTGTVLLVSHDRAFINNVVTSTLVLEGEGRVGEYVGGYDDWLRQAPPCAPPPATRPKPAPASRPQPKRTPQKLSFKERRELEALPEQIDDLEAEQRRLLERLADPALYRDAGDTVAGIRTRLEAIEAQLPVLEARWEELEARADR